jgi:hypothetical protein
MIRITVMAAVSATGRILNDSKHGAHAGSMRRMLVVGIPGRDGKDGAVSGTIPWPQITNKPIDIHIHTEPTPSDLWVINHNLGYKPPSVTVEDQAGRVIRGVISNPSVNQTRIEFNPPAAGTARIF